MLSGTGVRGARARERRVEWGTGFAWAQGAISSWWEPTSVCKGHAERSGDRGLVWGSLSQLTSQGPSAAAWPLLRWLGRGWEGSRGCGGWEDGATPSKARPASAWEPWKAAWEPWKAPADLRMWGQGRLGPVLTLTPAQKVGGRCPGYGAVLSAQ